MKKGILLLIMLGMFGWSCQKEKDTTGTFTVKMTDAPGDYDEVNVEILRVEINYSESNGWIPLTTNAGIYDLLLLRNNVTTVLNDHVNLPAGRIRQMRLILGTNNSVVADSVAFPLKVPSGYETGIKLNINADIRIDQNLEIVLDFDAAESVFLNGDGIYHLQPVIRVKNVSYN